MLFIKYGIRFIVYGGIVLLVAPDLIGKVISLTGDAFGDIIEGSTDYAVDKTQEKVQEKVGGFFTDKLHALEKVFPWAK